MKILSVDTSMTACSAAVVETEVAAPLAAAFVAMERGHAEALPLMVSAVMKEAGIAFSALDRIAVTIGPGTFTGLRIGLAFARGLGLACNIPVVGIDSLSAMAANETARSPLLVAADARNGEVYAAAFDGDRRLVHAPHVTTPAAAAATLAPGTLVLGTAAAAVAGASGHGNLTVSDAGDVPVAANFARLAADVPRGPPPSPLYLRAPDARPQAASLRKIGALTIEPAGASAAPLLAELHGEIFDEGWSAGAFAALLATPGAAAIIALDREHPVGFLVTRQAADEAEIITIGTRPSVQRRGVARQMLDAHLPRLAASGVRQVFLEVAASNVPAQALYRASGFSEAGRRNGYYKRPEGTEDAIVMRRELNP